MNLLEDESDSDSSSDDDEMEDDFLRNLIDYLQQHDVEDVPNEIYYNRDGSIRKRKRQHYRREARKTRFVDPWTVNPWLLLISDPNVNDPRHKKGKEFRRKFRMPFPVFQSIVQMCIDTGDPAFNYSLRLPTKEWSIPLELKLLCLSMLGHRNEVLRYLRAYYGYDVGVRM